MLPFRVFAKLQPRRSVSPVPTVAPSLHFRYSGEKPVTESLFFTLSFHTLTHSSILRIPQLLYLPLLCDFCIPDGSAGRKLPGVYQLFPFWNSPPTTRLSPPYSSSFVSYSCALFCTFLHSRKTQPFSFQPIPHSASKNRGCGEGTSC
jgi:hypothetical protein